MVAFGLGFGGGFVLIVVGAIMGNAQDLMMVGGASMLIGFFVGAVVATSGDSARDEAGDPTERSLAAATSTWTVPRVIRQFENSAAGLQRANREAGLLARHGYVVAAQSESGSHLNVGRTVSGTIATGGIALLFGGSRSHGAITITFTRT